jgi:hypothetical protein
MTTITGALTSIATDSNNVQLVSYADKTSETNYNISLYSANNVSFDLIENGINSPYYYSTALFDTYLNKYICYSEGVRIYSGPTKTTTVSFYSVTNRILFTYCLYNANLTNGYLLIGGTINNVPFIAQRHLQVNGRFYETDVAPDTKFDTFWSTSSLNPDNLPLSQYNITLANNNTNNPSVYVNLTFNDGVLDPVSYVIYGKDLTSPSESWTLL